MLRGGLHHADIDSGVLSGHARQHGLLRSLTRHPHILLGSVRLYGGLRPVADNGARMLQGGSVAQTSAAASCQVTRGNTDCSAPLAGSSTHRGGCTAGFGGSLATGRGCRKAGPITQAPAVASFQATPGNTDCSASLTGSTTSYPDRCSCTAGFGGSLITGRRCHKVDSIPQASEAALQDTRGNTDCSASSVGSCAGQSGYTADFD